MSLASGKKFLTVSIPAYNDMISLEKLVHEVENLCQSIEVDFQILIINDGSIDDTLSVAQRLAREYDNICVVHHEANKGFGYTLKEVFTLPDSEWVLFLPGDNQFPASNIPLFLAETEHYDYILGFRRDRRDSARRKIYSIVYNKILSLLSGVSVKDVNSIACYRRSALDQFELESTSAFIHAELFLKMTKNKFRVKELEVLHQEREFGFGAGGNLKVIGATIFDLIKMLLFRKI